MSLDDKVDASSSELNKLPPPACHRLQASANGGQVAQLIKMFYTYVLKSIKDAQLYIGWTDDLKQRIKNHNSGSVDATKFRIPFTLIYYEAYLSKEKAIFREKYLKSGFGRNFLKNRL